MFSVPVKSRKSPNGYELRKVPVLEPHLLFHHLFTTVGIDVPERRVHEYWRHHRHTNQEEWAVQSPASEEHVPVAFYGDSAKILDDGTKMLGIFMSMPAVWKPKSTRCARWCIFAIEEHRLYLHHTLNEVLRLIVVSLNIMFSGHDPQRPWLQLAAGRVFTVTELKGDWLWHKTVFRFWSSWSRLSHACFRCNAKARSNDPLQLYYCLDPHPHWTEYDVSGFLADQIREPDL